MDFRVDHLSGLSYAAAGQAFGDVIIYGTNLTQLMQQLNSMTPAQKSDYWISLAAASGKWVTLSSGGAQLASDSRMGRNSDGSLYWKTNGQQLGYATGVIDPPKHGVAGAIQDVGNVVSLLSSGFAALVDLVTQLVSEFGATLDGLLELAKFLASIASDVLALVDPTGTDASRKAALDKLNPLHKGGAVYNFITSAGYLRSRHLLALIIIAPLALFAYAILEILLGHVSPQFAQAMSPANLVDAAMQALAAVVQGLANGSNVFSIVNGVINGMLSAYGIQASPACIVKITYMVILGLPIPPIANIVITLLSDPVAQQSLANLVDVQGLTRVLPVAIACFDAADASSWLSCFEGLIQAFAPGIVTKLSQYAIDLNDLRVVVQGAWSTGGDIGLMLQSPALNAPERMAFGAANTTMSSMQSAMVGIGFFGVGLIAHLLGYSVNAADSLFQSAVVPLLPSGVANEVHNAIDVYAFCEQLLIDAGRISSPISVAKPPADFALYLLDQFHENKWDVEQTVFSVIADELNPSGSSVRFFTACVRRNGSGVVTVTPALKGLYGKLLLDYPKLRFSLDALAQHLGFSNADALVGVAAGGVTQNSVNVALTQTARGSSSSVSTGGNVSTANPKPKYTLPAGTIQPSSGKGTTLAPGVTPAATSNGINWGTLATAAAGGALLGGPAGALLGAAAGALFPSKVK